MVVAINNSRISEVTVNFHAQERNESSNSQQSNNVEFRQDNKIDEKSMKMKFVRQLQKKEIKTLQKTIKQ